MSEEASFPAETDVAGRLMLSGADALGSNPWIVPRPELEQHGLTKADLDDAQVERSRRTTEHELRQHGARVVSAFLVPLAAVAGMYVAFGGGSLTAIPSFEWVAYLGVSLILGAFAARAQTVQHQEALATFEDFMSLNDRRMAFRAKEREWQDEQRRRTTTHFWLDEIPKIAAEKGVPASSVFAQEVGKLFVAWGWLVRLNQRADDYGVDIFTSGKEGSAVVQCKHANGGPTPHDVRDLAGSRHAFGSDYGLLVSIHPPLATRQNEFFSEKGQLEFWHLGHILEQSAVLYKQRTGDDAPADSSRSQFLNADGTPIAWQGAAEKDAAE
jgi:hypothetical protein